jgi:hypothetical protein
MIARGIASLWRGEPPLSTIFWEYVIGWGTLFNLVCSGAALALILNGRAEIGLATHFAAVPVNAFLIVSVFRAAAREHSSPLANFSRIGAIVWFVVMLVF